MENYTKIMIVGLIILAIALVIYPNITGQTVKNKYEYTTAICDKTNFCQDYLVSCEENKLTNINPITGASVQNSKNWKDPRGIQSDNYCK